VSYTGWGETEAAADAQARGISGGDGITVGSINARVDEYINDLIQQSQGDRDFIIRQLNAQHEMALGSDKGEEAAFLERVADKLEEKIGRIPYDFEKYSARELDDFAKGTQRLTENKDIALRRLGEDEKVAQRQLEINREQERRGQGESLSQRGLLTGTREETVGLGAKSVGELEENLQSRQDALTRSVSRTGEEIGLTFGRGISDITTAKDRGLEDLTTQARRAALGQQQSTQYGLESANRAADARKKLLEKQRQQEKLYSPSYAYTGLV